MKRHNFWRYLENWLGRKAASLWRIEWKQRLSGTMQGEWYPHFHYLIFGIQFLPKDDIKEWWRKSINADGIVITWIEKLRSQEQASLYVAKYAAKVDSTVLDDAAYLSKRHGRHWGFHRKGLIPLCDEKEIRVSPSSAIEHAREIATKKLPASNVTGMESFTLIGDTVQEVRKFLDSIGWSTDDNTV